MATDVRDPVAKLKIANIPSRVISNIVDNLKDHGDHVSLLLVCKGWCKTVAEAMYRAPPLFSPDSFERLMGLLYTPLPALPYTVMIRELDISGTAADNLYMGDLDATLGMCPNLEVFRLENCFHISNILVQSLAHHCQNLLQLDLPGCPISDSFIPALTKKCRHLLRLDLSFTNVSIASIHPVITFSESLLELDLSECQEADLTSLDLSNKGLRRALKSLNLRNSPVTDDMLRFAASQCPDLEIIILESCPRVTDDAIIKIATTCVKLRSLDCSFCDRITDLSLNALTVRATASNGGTLEELYLSACDLISPGAVHQMVQKSTKLELLVLDGCEKIMGSYIQEFATNRTDDLECSLEGESLKSLANYVVGTSLATPPASPGRLLEGGAPQPELKVEVTYATHEPSGSESAEERRRKNAKSGFAAAIIRNVLAPGEAAATIAAAKEAAAAHAASMESSPTGSAGTSPSLQRRSSRTLRHRRSLLGLSARNDDDEEDAAAAKLERQEKIREKRRSRTSSFDGKDFSMRLSFQAPPSPPSSSSSFAPTTGLTSEPESMGASAIDEAAARAAFLAAAAAKGLKVAKPGDEATTPTPAPDRHHAPANRQSTLSLKASEFVPSFQQPAQPQPSQPPPSATAAGWNSDSPSTASSSSPAWGTGVPGIANDPWSAPPASRLPQRKLSVGTPAGPPAPGTAGSWTAPVGIAPPPAQSTPISVITSAAPTPSIVAAVPASPAPGGESGVLLFSGRARRAASITQAEAAEASSAMAALNNATTDGPTATGADGADGEQAPVLIASGRRRTRTNSLLPSDTPPADLAAPATPPGVAPISTTSATASASGPTWIHQPATPTVPPQAQTPWGSDPAVWNNPAQLISSSSTWSTAQQGGSGFVDPWAAAPRPSTGVLGPAPITNAVDPWAAAPGGVKSPVNPTAAWVPPAVSAAQPVAPQPPAPQLMANGMKMAAGAGWTGGAVNGTAGGAVSGVTTVAGAGWGPSVPPAPQGPPPAVLAAAAAAAAAAGATTAAKAPRPGSVGYVAGAAGRFGSVGASARGNWGVDAKREVEKEKNVTPTATAVAVKPAAAEEGGEKPAFEYSNPKRGRMLLKLRIETKTGGHQTLSVHELDDPQQLATEFVTYWDMAAFKEPLVRLISTRRNGPDLF
ncbi:hypothetical protein HK101_000324 [Irineochytrium annulatum]|nr:hypothetical protein HK101_000324 [Irineochytrium annulatum]